MSARDRGRAAEPTLGSGPIEEAYVEKMHALGHTLDNFLNQTRPRESGFVLLVFPFGAAGGRCNYISNAAREDVVTMLREQLRYFEGQSDAVTPGRV